MIAVRNLGQAYGGKEILRGINLDVARGEVFAIIGPTGAGKTTLLRLIDLLERPMSGSIYFDGLNTDASEKVRLGVRRRMAMVSQKPLLFNCSVFDNVAYGLKIRKEKRVNWQREATNALASVGLSGYESRNARTLSGGEAQRIALARALVVGAEVLLLDEPCANLDPVSQAHVEKLIARIIRESNTTVIMATHDLSQGQRLADRMGVLIGGQILQTGTPQELFSSPRNREIAEFVGVENILSGIIASNEEGIVTVDIGGYVVEGISSFAPGEKVCACVRPEDITLAPARALTSARNTFMGRVTRVISVGPVARVEIDCGFLLIALVTKRSAEELELKADKEVYASFKATTVQILSRKVASSASGK